MQMLKVTKDKSRFWTVCWTCFLVNAIFFVFYAKAHPPLCQGYCLPPLLTRNQYSKLGRNLQQPATIITTTLENSTSNNPWFNTLVSTNVVLVHVVFNFLASRNKEHLLNYEMDRTQKRRCKHYVCIIVLKILQELPQMTDLYRGYLRWKAINHWIARNRKGTEQAGREEEELSHFFSGIVRKLGNGLARRRIQNVKHRRPVSAPIHTPANDNRS